MEAIRWSGGGGIAFFASSNEIRAFRDLSISVAAETEDTTDSGEKFVKKKNNGGYSITLNAVLLASLGVNVQQTALAISEASRKGDTGYFYANGIKIFPSQFMAVDAKITKINLNAGIWTECEVAWTLKQCGKFGDGSPAQNSSGGPKNPSTDTQTLQKWYSTDNPNKAEVKDELNSEKTKGPVKDKEKSNREKEKDRKKEEAEKAETLADKADKESERILNDARSKNTGGKPQGGAGSIEIRIVDIDSLQR